MLSILYDNVARAVPDVAPAQVVLGGTEYVSLFPEIVFVANFGYPVAPLINASFSILCSKTIVTLALYCVTHPLSVSIVISCLCQLASFVSVSYQSVAHLTSAAVG